MLKIEKGGVYTASRVRSGTSGRGDWELIVVKAEGKSRHIITIFPTNIPSGVIEGKPFQVKDISSAEIKTGKNKDGSWGKDITNMEAEVTPFGDLEDLDGLDDIYGGELEL